MDIIWSKKVFKFSDKSLGSDFGHFIKTIYLLVAANLWNCKQLLQFLTLFNLKILSNCGLRDTGILVVITINFFSAFVIIVRENATLSLVGGLRVNKIREGWGIYNDISLNNWSVRVSNPFCSVPSPLICFVANFQQIPLVYRDSEPQHIYSLNFSLEKFSRTMG